jgi:hypothetical protein
MGAGLLLMKRIAIEVVKGAAAPTRHVGGARIAPRRLA